MCFSPSVSFISAAILAPAGIYGIYKANQCDLRYIFFLAIPFIFSIQQTAEGLVWLGLLYKHISMVKITSLIYLFFAYFFWPIYIPLSLYFIEERISKKNNLILLTVIGGVIGLSLYAPVIVNYLPLEVTIVNYSIQYFTHSMSFLALFVAGLYIAVITLALAISRLYMAKLFSLLVFTSVVVALYWYCYNFTSVWCFFSAIVSIFIVFTAFSLKKSNTERRQI